jgi:hypothetical protein
MNPDWTEEFPGNIAVCDTRGSLLAINQKEASFFQEQGGKALVGTSISACHNPHSNRIIARMMETRQTSIYTVEENGRHELIIQAPWYQDGEFAGLVEIAIEAPENIPHIIR